MSLAFLIPFSQGWQQAQVAAITIMLIATMGSLNESILKGSMRILGTLIGAIVGLTLIALFPQERFLYLISLSISVSVFLYLVRAYKGDPSVFMLSAMTMMMMFDNGAVDNVFIYGLDKIYMGIFGITIYTLVSIFIWPTNIEDSTQKTSHELSLLQHDLFSKRDSKKEDYSKLLTLALQKESILETSSIDISSTSLDSGQLRSINYNYKKINELLALEMHHSKIYTQYDDEITRLFKEISSSYETKEEISIPPVMSVTYTKQMTQDYSHLQRASLVSEIKNLEKLHNELRLLAQKLNALHSPLPTFFDIENIPSQSNFIWGNVEHIKATLVTFIIFWVSTFIWIYFNPPAGFMIVTLATGLSVLTVFTPLKPSILITVFSFSFIFACLMYVFVLPGLHYAWELALFIFFYSFISFYFLPAKLTVLFLIGLFTLGISNQMNYNFNVFILILTMFYIFLLILQFFYYIPFSTKAEHLFLTLQKRFFKLSSILYERSNKIILNKDSIVLRIFAVYAYAHLTFTLKSMQLWAGKIDFKYFNKIDKNKLEKFTQESEKFAYFLNLLYYQNLKMKKNTLIIELREKEKIPSYSMTNMDVTADSVEEKLSSMLDGINFDMFTKEDIIDFYENISLRKNVWISFFKCQKLRNELDFQTLKATRF